MFSLPKNSIGSEHERETEGKIQIDKKQNMYINILQIFDYYIFLFKFDVECYMLNNRNINKIHAKKWDRKFFGQILTNLKNLIKLEVVF